MDVDREAEKLARVLRSSSSQLEERSFPHAAVCVVETQVIGSASGKTRAKITSSLSSGSKSPFQTTAIRTFRGIVASQFAIAWCVDTGRFLTVPLKR